MMQKQPGLVIIVVRRGTMSSIYHGVTAVIMWR